MRTFWTAGLLFFVPLTSGVLFEYRLRCPDTSAKWKENSDSYICGDGTVYHCMQDQEGRYVVFCAASMWVQPDYCPEFNIQASMMDVTLCRGTTDRCPDTVYLSNTVYKFPGCFWSMHRTTRRPQPTVKNSTTVYPSTSSAPFTQKSENQYRQVELLGSILGIIVPCVIFSVLWIIFRQRLKKRGRKRSSYKEASHTTQGESDLMIAGNRKEMAKTKEEDVPIAQEANSSENYFEPKLYKNVVDTLQKKRSVLLQGNLGSGKTAMANYIARSTFSDYKIIKMVSKAKEPPGIHGDRSLILWDDCFGLWRMTKEIDPPVLENLRSIIQLTKDNSKKILVVICVDTFYVTDDLYKDWSENCFLFNLDKLYEAQLDKERFIECYKEYIRPGRLSQDVGFPLLIDLIHAEFCPRADSAKFLEDPFTYVCNDIDRLCRDDCDGYVTLIYAVCKSPRINLKNINEEHWGKLKGEYCSKKIVINKEEHGDETELESDEKVKQREEEEPLDPNNDNYHANKQDVALGCKTKSLRALEEGNNKILNFLRRKKKVFAGSKYDLGEVSKTLSRYLIETEENFIFRFRHHYLAECVLKFHVKHFGTDTLIKTATTEIKTEIKHFENLQ